MGSSIGSRFERSKALGWAWGLELWQMWLVESCMIDQMSRIHLLKDWRRGEPMLQGWVLEALRINYCSSIGHLRCKNARRLRSSWLNACMPYRLIGLNCSHTSSWARLSIQGRCFRLYFFDPLTIHVLMPTKQELHPIGGIHKGLLELGVMSSSYVIHKLLLLVAFPQRLQITIWKIHRDSHKIP